MKSLLVLGALILAHSALAADDQEASLQKQVSQLEALANEAQKPNLALEAPRFASAAGVKLSAGGTSTAAANGVLGSSSMTTGTEAVTAVKGADGKAADVQAESSIPALKAPETEIPVLTKFNKKVEADAIGAPTRVLATFGIVIGVLVGGLFFLRRYTKKQSTKVKHTQIRVMAQHHLGPKKSVAIIRVAGESILIGVTDQSISMIKQLHILDEDMPEEEITEDFRQRLERSTGEGTDRPSLTAPIQKPKAALQAKVPAAGAPVRPAQGPRVASGRPAHPVAAARQVFESETDEQLNEGDEFMMRGIRDIVSDRLRNRKTLV